jgi:hypothetical protein
MWQPGTTQLSGAPGTMPITIAITELQRPPVPSVLSVQDRQVSRTAMLDTPVTQAVHPLNTACQRFQSNEMQQWNRHCCTATPALQRNCPHLCICTTAR